MVALCRDKLATPGSAYTQEIVKFMPEKLLTDFFDKGEET